MQLNHRAQFRVTNPSPKRQRGVERGVERWVEHPSRAFSLVELLVVIVVIVILLSAVLAASSTLFAKAKKANTQALLAVVTDAVEQFKREQTAKPTITRARQGVVNYVKYMDRYGYFPPDELEVFTDIGIPGSGAGGQTLAPGRAEMVPAPAPGYGAMGLYTKGLPAAYKALEHRDIAAMIVAIQTLGDASNAILDRIQDRYWLAPLDENGNPTVFLDRDGNGTWDSDDHQIRYIIDDWGNPLSYLAQRDWEPPPTPANAASNHPNWNEASTELIRLNAGQPLIFSYGPDGKDQLTLEQMGDNGAASLVGDFEGLSGTKHKIDHLLNADNVYADPSLKEKLAEGIP